MSHLFCSSDVSFFYSLSYIIAAYHVVLLLLLLLYPFRGEESIHMYVTYSLSPYATQTIIIYPSVCLSVYPPIHPRETKGSKDVFLSFFLIHSIFLLYFFFFFPLSLSASQVHHCFMSPLPQSGFLFCLRSEQFFFFFFSHWLTFCFLRSRVYISDHSHGTRRHISVVRSFVRPRIQKSIYFLNGGGASFLHFNGCEWWMSCAYLLLFLWGPSVATAATLSHFPLTLIPLSATTTTSRLSSSFSVAGTFLSGFVVPEL